jgi:indole-3-glycerol phosphate synthase
VNDSESVLHGIAKSVEMRLLERKNLLSYEELLSRVSRARKPQPFVNAFMKSGLHTIAEVKFRSPAVGVLQAGTAETAVKIAQEYLKNGATAISVLTEEDHFLGSADYLRALRAAEPNALILMKDFILEEYQILEGMLMGADAVLLIVSLLGKARTEKLLKFTSEMKIAALVEVHDQEELSQAISMGACLIGINNRNLRTLAVDLNTSFQLIQQLPEGSSAKIALISESGIRSGSEMKRLRAAGFSGFLIGSAFVGSAHPGESLRQFLQEAGE